MLVASIGQGHDVRTVAGRLSHTDPAMTLRVYAHAFAAADQALAAAPNGSATSVPKPSPSGSQQKPGQTQLHRDVVEVDFDVDV